MEEKHHRPFLSSTVTVSFWHFIKNLRRPRSSEKHHAGGRRGILPNQLHGGRVAWVGPCAWKGEFEVRMAGEGGRGMFRSDSRWRWRRFCRVKQSGDLGGFREFVRVRRSLALLPWRCRNLTSSSASGRLERKGNSAGAGQLPQACLAVWTRGEGEEVDDGDGRWGRFLLLSFSLSLFRSSSPRRLSCLL